MPSMLVVKYYMDYDAIDAIDERGHSNKMCCQIQPKKTKVMLIIIYNSKMCFRRCHYQQDRALYN